MHFKCRSPGYAVLPKAYGQPTDSTMGESSGETTSTGEQFVIPGGQVNLSFPRFPHCAFVPFQLPRVNGNMGEASSSKLNIPDSQLEAQKKIIQQQIEVSFMCHKIAILAFSIRLCVTIKKKKKNKRLYLVPYRGIYVLFLAQYNNNWYIPPLPTTHIHKVVGSAAWHEITNAIVMTFLRTAT